MPSALLDCVLRGTGLKGYSLRRAASTRILSSRLHAPLHRPVTTLAFHARPHNLLYYRTPHHHHVVIQCFAGGFRLSVCDRQAGPCRRVRVLHLPDPAPAHGRKDEPACPEPIFDRVFPPTALASRFSALIKTARRLLVRPAKGFSGWAANLAAHLPSNVRRKLTMPPSLLLARLPSPTCAPRPRFRRSVARRPSNARPAFSFAHGRSSILAVSSIGTPSLLLHQSFPAGSSRSTRQRRVARFRQASFRRSDLSLYNRVRHSSPNSNNSRHQSVIRRPQPKTPCVVALITARAHRQGLPRAAAHGPPGQDLC